MKKKIYTAPEAEFEKFTIYCEVELSGHGGLDDEDNIVDF